MTPIVSQSVDYLRSLLDTAIKIPMAVALRNCLRVLPVAPTDNSVPPEVNALHTTLDSLGGDPYLRPLENPREALVALVDFVYCQEDIPDEAQKLCLDALNSLEPDSTEVETRQRLNAALQALAEALVTRHKERLSR